MKCNIGKTDRVVRVVLGAALLGYGYGYDCILADVVGVALIVTAAIGWCPPYALLGINTGCKAKDVQKGDEESED